ncbi:MAG: GAF domain-containing sensor histidine kinase [Gaiellaceae bacterium]
MAGGAVLEAAVQLPFAGASAGEVLGIPSAIALAVATATALLVGTVEGVVVAEAGALVFAAYVSHFHPGGIAALVVWPLLVLLAGLFSDRVSQLRRHLEGQLAEANERLRALVDTGIGLGSALDLDALLQLVVDAATTLTGAAGAALDVVDRRGAPTTSLRSGLHPPEGEGALAVPILLRGIAYGHLKVAAKDDGGAHEPHDQELLELLAAQAAVAIENRRLYESASRWSWQLESLTELSTALSSELELDPLLNHVAAGLRRLVGARTSAVWLPGRDGLLRAAAADGAIAAEVLKTPPLGPDSKTGRVFASGRSSRVDALLDDPEVDAAAVRRLEVGSGLWVPLAVGDTIVGVLSALDKDDPDRRFSDEDARLAEVFAARAAASVAVARRAEEAAIRKVVAAQEAERRRLALALHDGTAQELASIMLQLRTAEPDLEEVRRLLVETLKDVRRLSVELHPKALDDFGLVPALERLTESVAEHACIEVHLQASIDGARLSHDTETALFRIVQEALENVCEHAFAEHASVLLVRRGDSVSAVVEDDGRGFDPVAETEGLGLAGIRERVRLLGGTLSVESRPGAGATVAVEVPLTN